ncbi:MAG: hypothetical protein JWL77_2981 [Chthonomonadaceae bacterium]|nr:hypothetical protein [Chthonomonadaceae bacterium]
MTRKAISLSLGMLSALWFGLNAPQALAQKPTAHSNRPTTQKFSPSKEELNDDLLTAIANRAPAKVRALLKKGADPNIVFEGSTVLILAAASGPKRLSGLRLTAEPADADMVLALLEAGANPNAATKLGRTALANSITDRSGVICELLLDHQASVDLADRHGVTPLMLAAVEGSEHVMDILLAHKANPNARTEDGQNALSVQIINRSEENPEDVQFTGYIGPFRDSAFLKLLDHGADINVKLDSGDTLLMVAISRSNMNYVPLLLEKGADINAQSKDGVTPLLYAAHKGHPQIVRYLLDHGADPKCVGPDGIAALYLGVEQGNFAIVEMLIKKGVALSAKKTDGETALMLARKKKLTGLVNLLIAAGAKE